MLSAVFGDSLSDKTLPASAKLVRFFTAHPTMDPGDILWGFESYLHAYPQLDKGYAMVMKVAYDKDLIEDDALIAHYTKPDAPTNPGYEAAKKFAAPFIQWLQQSDDEDSDSD